MKTLLGIIVAGMISPLYAYDEKNFADLSVPLQLSPQSLEFNIIHRFYRDPSGDFPDNFITMANVAIALRYAIWSKLEVGAGWFIDQKEYELNAAYSYFLPALFLRTQASIRFFGVKIFDDLGNSSTQNNAVYQINLQSDPIARRFFPTINLIYDGLSQKFGIGTGIDVALPFDLDFVGEYFPVMGTRDSAPFGGGPLVNCYSIGIKKSTYGHHFMFTVSNTTDIGIRRLMRGTVNNNMRFGFNIQRLIPL